MSETSIANLVAFISTIFTFLNISGVTTSEISAAVQGIVAIVAIVSVVWSTFAHKRQVGALKQKLAVATSTTNVSK